MNETRLQTLTNAQIDALATRYQAGDRETFNELWNGWLQKYQASCILHAATTQRLPEDRLNDVAVEATLTALAKWNPKRAGRRATFKTFWGIVWKSRLKNALTAYWSDHGKFDRAMLELDRPLNEDEEDTLHDTIAAPVQDWEAARANVEARFSRLRLSKLEKRVIAEHLRDPLQEDLALAKRLKVNKWTVYAAHERIKRKAQARAGSSRPSLFSQ